MHVHLAVESPIRPTPRVCQVRGLFDLPVAAVSRREWDVSLPLEERSWHIGLITGPSGCGKSTLARHLWPDACTPDQPWPAQHSILDGFPEDLSITDITTLLSSVGFSSPPDWLRPFAALSTGQQFRATLARLLAQRPTLAVIDEYTSTVDRTVAQLGSAALARTVRQRGQQLVAVTCHADVIDWLTPDWTYEPAPGTFTWRCLQPRPPIPLTLRRCPASCWRLFAPHHYLSHALAPGAVCFLATWKDRPVAFSAWISFFGAGPPARREHRTVTLPDYQGVGIGSAVSSTLAGLWVALGYRARSTTTHPALIRSRLRSPLWHMTRPPSLARPRHNDSRRLLHATTRLTAGFEYVGPSLPRYLAHALLATQPG